MEQNEEIEMQLWEYIDGICIDADKQRISDLIANDHIWQKKFDELSALHNAISGNMELEQPSLRFSKNVMEAVNQVKIAPATKKYINTNIIKGIAAFFIIAIVGVLVYALATSNWTPSSKPDLLSNLLPTTKYNFSSLFSSDLFNIVLGVNIILGLLLIDALLRRKRTHHTS